MPPPSGHRKILFVSLSILLLLFSSSNVFAATTQRTYELLDSPNGSTNYHLKVMVSDTLYANYTERNHVLYNYDFSKFVTPNALKPIADDLWSIYSNKEDFANGVLMLVHQIPYKESDPQKFAVETIFENEGDCDLLTILAASIMKAGGIDVVLLFLEAQDHMFLGINLPERPKDARSTVYFYRYQERKYYVAETTGGSWETGWRVGECPEVLQRALAKVIAVSSYEVEAPGQVSSSYSIPDSSALYINLSTSFAVAQNDVKITGSLYPSLAGENVTLYLSSIGSPSTLLATVVTDADGGYSYDWISPPSGIYSIKAKWSGDDDYNSADSTTFQLLVIPSELLIIVITIIFLLIVLLIVNMTTQEKTSHKQEASRDWEIEDYPQDFGNLPC
jgi:hypothetical protein